MSARVSSKGLPDKIFAMRFSVHMSSPADDEAMARVLEVNPEWLLGRSDQRERESDVGFDDFTYALHRETRELTEENRNKLLEMARIFRAAQQADKDK